MTNTAPKQEYLCRADQVKGIKGEDAAVGDQFWLDSQWGKVGVEVKCLIIVNNFVTSFVHVSLKQGNAKEVSDPKKGFLNF